MECPPSGLAHVATNGCSKVNLDHTVRCLIFSLEHAITLAKGLSDEHHDKTPVTPPLMDGSPLLLSPQICEKTPELKDMLAPNNFGLPLESSETLSFEASTTRKTSGGPRLRVDENSSDHAQPIVQPIVHTASDNLSEMLNEGFQRQESEGCDLPDLRFETERSGLFETERSSEAMQEPISPALNDLCLRDAWQHMSEDVLNHYLSELATRRPDFQSSASFVMITRPGLAALRRQRFRSSNSSLKLSMFQWIVGPLSMQRLVWELAIFVFVAHDVITVPMQVFDLQDTVATDVLEFICATFWMVDILMSFRTSYYIGHVLETSAIAVARAYAKTWFFGDFLMAAVQLTRLVAGPGLLIESIQMLRMIRLYKLSRLKRAVTERSNSNHVHLYLECVQVVIQFAIAIHFITCGWYLIGKEGANGWINEEHMRGVDGLYTYFASCRWTIAQVSGRTDLEVRTTAEYVYTVMACVFGFLCMSVFISSITNTMIELGALDRERMYQIRLLNGYLKRKHVNSEFAQRIKADFQVQQKVAMDFGREAEVIKVLPKQIMMDLLYEIRAPIMSVHTLMSDFITEFPRMLRRVCAETVSVVSAQQDELMFTRGDACTRVLFIEFGLLVYKWAAKRKSRPTLMQRPETPSGERKRRFSTCSKSSQDNDDSLSTRDADLAILDEGQWLSEAALWVEWENCGTLTATKQSSLLGLEVPEFIGVVRQFRDARARSVLYAREFLSHLSKVSRKSDLLPPISDYLPKNCEEVVQTTYSSEGTSNSPLSLLR